MADTITYQRHEPLAALKKYISYYWYMENGVEEEQAYPDLLIPDGYPEIIFILEGGYHKRPLADESQVMIVNRSSVVGIQHQSLLVKRMGKVKLFGIKFKPMGFYRFFGPMTARTLGHTLSLDEFDVPYLLELEDSLKKSESPDKAVAGIDRALSDQRSRILYTKKEDIVEECINEILETQGNLGLNELSVKVGKGKRQIQRYFKECVGISPKRFSKLIRFKSVYKKDVLSDTSLGHFFDHGYFDQSHLIKDFRANLGTTPSHTSSQKFRALNAIAKKSVRP